MPAFLIYQNERSIFHALEPENPAHLCRASSAGHGADALRPSLGHLFPPGRLTCLGRLAFPIFAFLLAEGFRQTKNRKNYLLRLFFWALVSEIPFNLMYSGQVFYPVHQNVLWIFCLSLLLLWGMDWLRQRFPPPLAWLLCAALAAAGFFLGYLIMADYYGPGVLTVLVFSLFPKRDWKSFCGQFVCLALIHGLMLGSFLYTIPSGFIGENRAATAKGSVFCAMPFIPAIWRFWC